MIYKTYLNTCYVPGTILRMFTHCLIHASEQPYQAGIIFISVLLRRKLRHKELNHLSEVIRSVSGRA